MVVFQHNIRRGGLSSDVVAEPQERAMAKDTIKDTIMVNGTIVERSRDEWSHDHRCACATDVPTVVTDRRAHTFRPNMSPRARMRLLTIGSSFPSTEQT
jgi:hypothetical protein